jgi:HNH endonuclease
MNPHYHRVAERAAHRCEYCHVPERVFNFAFEVEHVIPVSLLKSDDDSNLALACRACNVRKSDHCTGIDDTSQSETRLLHPRQDRWEDHFQVDGQGVVHGKTAIGRATANRLNVNNSVQREARKQWMRLGLFP